MRYLPLLIQLQQELSWMNYMLGSSKFEVWNCCDFYSKRKFFKGARFLASDNLGNPYPSMIIEVCNTQSLPDHHQKVALYFSLRTTIPNRIGN
ncbi:hypothetical protein RhiirC2_745326 [Rhizophagus irregularis]|uniref:Uncharacterized protein n=1 Tax=Rhizophagus irregularis TaxID=588596 RepID=A0A2N1NAY4_9GLOM|nr:hypothetical protein RhiirC2_745326 [Rhizophagus irregularis]